ncbi:MAG: hypothetical protein CMN34_08780 [Saprospirales bacterium]|nr:hypothetical protein [Saprospirales bacterium]
MPETNIKILQGRLDDAERKIRVLEDMIENASRELYIANQDLKNKNKDLEQIIYIVSHDLQEPLTTLYAFLGRLANKHHQELSSQGQEYLNYANISAERMRALIKGLLDHSRIGAKQMAETTDFNKVVKDVMLGLNSIIQESKANITIENLPTLKAYAIESQLLFENLIHNAIKFSKPGHIPVIRIGAEEMQTHVSFYIEDEGIGIEEAFHDKVFKIYQQLSRKPGGVGIGLAHCKKIALMHEGDLWIDNTYSEGCRFCFTFSKEL